MNVMARVLLLFILQVMFEMLNLKGMFSSLDLRIKIMKNFNEMKEVQSLAFLGMTIHYADILK